MSCRAGNNWQNLAEIGISSPIPSILIHRITFCYRARLISRKAEQYPNVPELMK